jgi:hypothetical protein
MKRIKSKKQLNSVTDTDIVLVESTNRVFFRDSGDWIERSYFTTKDAAIEVGVSENRIREWAYKLRILKRNKEYKFSLDDIIKLHSVRKLRYSKHSFKKINEILH